MIITTTTTLNISEANSGLIPLVVESIGYKEWEANVIAQAQQDENYVPEDTQVLMNTFIKEFLAKDATQRLANLIAPQVDRYFGVVMQAQASVVKDDLSTAITSVVEITN